jgi:hypothetical protein
MSDSRLGFHARFPPGPTDNDVAAAHDAAAAAVGLELLGVERHRFVNTPESTSRMYGERNGPEPLRFGYTLDPGCQLVMLDGYHYRGRECYAPGRIADMFTRICVALDAPIGRSDLGLGHAFVNESEMDGDLAFVDWYQYLAPRIVDRLGRRRLLAAPAFQVTEHEGGGIVMLLADDPWSEGLARRPVADYLGIVLPPSPARNPATGEPIEIPWR